MPTHIAFLRAVNVGRRTVKMSRLAEVCREVGYDDVWTFINSGNVAFSTSGSRASIEEVMEQALADEFGFEVTTFVRTPAELRRVLDAEPFEVAQGDTYFVTFLKEPPSAVTARALKAESNDFDTLVVRGSEVHWRMHGKSTETTLTRAAWKIVGPLGSTSRNITMLRKLSAKLEG